MQNQVALGAKRSSTAVKGGIARAPGSRKPGMGMQHNPRMAEQSDALGAKKASDADVCTACMCFGIKARKVSIRVSKTVYACKQAPGVDRVS